jgi:hypothetical protein
MYSPQPHLRQLSTPVCRKKNFFPSFIVDYKFLTHEQYLSSRTHKYLPRDGTSKVLKQDQTQTSILLPLTVN